MKRQPPSGFGWFVWVVTILLAMLFALIVHLIATMRVAHARDDGRYAASPLKPWFDSLRSGRGPCCSDADGTAISDADWESKDGHYRVRLPHHQGDPDSEWEWVDVPDDAVITVPNRAGRTMAWPIYGTTIVIRCFMPGPMG